MGASDLHQVHINPRLALQRARPRLYDVTTERGWGPLRLCSLKTVEQQTQTGHSFTHAFTPKLRSPTCGIPHGDSWKVAGLPFCSLEQALTTDSWDAYQVQMSCEESRSTSPRSPAGPRLPGGLELQGEAGPGILSGSVAPLIILGSSLLQCSRATGW